MTAERRSPAFRLAPAPGTTGLTQATKQFRLKARLRKSLVVS